MTDRRTFIGGAAAKSLTFPERCAPGFAVNETGHECQWNGPGWPYATSLALTALVNRPGSAEDPVLAELFVRLLRQYAEQQKLTKPNGRTVSWIDECVNPFTGVWQSRKMLIEQGKTAIRERGKDYNHSTFCDLVITGLCGLVPRDDGKVEVRPRAPAEWDWWCLDGVRYHGRDLTILFDRDGTHYGRGKGLQVLDR